MLLICLNPSEGFLFQSSLVAQTVKRLPTMWETRIWSLGQEDPLEEEMANYSSTLAWKIPWTGECGRLQSTGSQRVGHDWVISLFFHFRVKAITLPVACSTLHCLIHMLLLSFLSLSLLFTPFHPYSSTCCSSNTRGILLCWGLSCFRLFSLPGMLFS